MTGYLIAQVRLIFQPVAVANRAPLLYVEFFNFSNMHYAMVNNTRVVSPAPGLEMFVAQCWLQSNGRPLGDVIPLDHV